MRQNMIIYKNEIIDNLSDVIRDSDSIAFSCDIIPKKDSDENFLPENIKTAIACLGSDKYKQDDLYYLTSVLVSAGWNKNDDVFIKENLWAARHTPVNKPFNYMHDQSDIIGHITGSMILDEKGNLVPDDASDEQIPDYFDIITSAVIYKAWADQDQRERIKGLTEEIDNGLWSVSMECVFSNFDYAVIDKDGNNRILERNEESSFLTKHLRAYGGTGEYNGYKLGRLLKALYFNGKGLVNKPANPRSVIFSKDLDPFNSKANISINNFLTTAEVNEMTEDITEQISKLTKELEEAKAELSSVRDLLKEKEEAISKASSDLSETIGEKDKTIASFEAKVKELEDIAEAAKKEKQKSEEEMEMMKKDMKNMKRKDKLSKAGADEAKADELVAKFETTSDELFESIVSLINFKSGSDSTQASASDNSEDEVADAAELDSVENVEDSINDGGNQQSENTAIASAVEWLSNSVLKSTKKSK